MPCTRGQQWYELVPVPSTLSMENVGSSAFAWPTVLQQMRNKDLILLMLVCLD